MAKITFLLGLAGSGKSHKAKELFDETGAFIFEGVVHNGTQDKIAECLRNGVDCSVEEGAYCDPSDREGFISYLQEAVASFEIDFVCFEKDLETANWNVMNRENKGPEYKPEDHVAHNKTLMRIYEYPIGVIPIQICRIPAKGS